MLVASMVNSSCDGSSARKLGDDRIIDLCVVMSPEDVDSVEPVSSDV